MQSTVARLRAFAEWVSAILFVLLFAAFLLQVFTRYVLNDPVTWTQEFVLIVYIWIVFWCAAFLVRPTEHITFDMVAISLPWAARRVLAAILAAIVGTAFLAALPATVDYISFMKIEKSPVMGIRFDVLYAIFALFVAAAAVASVIRIARLLGRSWREELRTGAEVESEP